MPVTRSKAHQIAEISPIDGYLHSDSRHFEKTTAKRQKIDHASSNLNRDNMEVDSLSAASSSISPSTKFQDPYDPNKNAHLKGRKRFTADLEDMKNAAKKGYASQGLRLKRIGPGDDEGSFEVAIDDAFGKHLISVNFLVSDTSEYPKSHSLFCFSPDPDISSRLQRIVEGVVEERPRPIREAVDGLFSSVAKATATPSRKRVIDSEDEESHSGDESEVYDYDDDFDIGIAKVEPNTVMFRLQENFVDIVASSYRPGLIRLGGGDDFVISVSLPVITLSETIPPRALMAWDRCLLSRSQHLTLLISGFRGVYPPLNDDGTYTAAAHKISTNLTFKVGLSAKYKPGKEQVQEAVRKHGLIIQDAEDELRIQVEKEKAAMIQQYDWDDDEAPVEVPVQPAIEEEPEDDENRFDRFSLSSSLESLIDQAFLRVVQIRRNFGLGWAGAEALYHEMEKYQRKAEDIYDLKRKDFIQADREEATLGRTISLPHDPLAGLSKDQPINLPLTAFCYLIRRLALCTKYCIVCHNKLKTDFEALKPYVCDSKLCSYQYYSLNRGPSLEYEIIHNPQTVDLLVSLAYVAATDGAMEEPLPIGMGLRVPVSASLAANAYVAPLSVFGSGLLPGMSGSVGLADPASGKQLEAGSDGLCEFDSMNVQQMRATIAKLIDMLPSIDEMRKHLQRKVQAGKSKPKLRDIDPDVLPAAWSILRWIVCSCTSYIEEITSGEELIKNLDPNWRQFKLTVGAPDAEAKFKAAVDEAVSSDSNAAKYPILYAFHGSPLRNWHSIVRHGLWYKVITHGRAYGNGVYLAKDATISMGHYAQAARSAWRKSQTSPTNCVALAELVNLPQKFVSNNPFFVVADTHWIMCRYLLLKGVGTENDTPSSAKFSPDDLVPFVKLDPAHPTVVAGKNIQIPDPSHQIQSILDARRSEYTNEEPDEEDMHIFQLDPSKVSASDPMDIDEDDDEDYRVPSTSASKASVPHVRPKDDWKHDQAYVQSAVERLMVPPFESTPGASAALQKEMRSMLKEQDTAKSYKDLGWYMPPELIGDNLYQWIVEMHSFDPDIPIAKDLKAKKINSVIFEIRFPARFPISPPFFRIITPRFLPFIHGGGGHVTGGGSICMDLLTADGWLPSYNIPAILMQIKLAISNLEPRPARLSSDWHRPYEVAESLAGFKRAAATHGWTLPDGIDRLVR